MQMSGPGDFALQATDDEVTSLLVRMLAEHPGETPVEDPRVCFSPGKVYMLGHFKGILPFEFEGALVVEPRLVDGQLSIEITDASAGSVAMPGPLLRSSSKIISETLSEWLPDVQFIRIDIDEGQIVVSGRRGG